MLPLLTVLALVACGESDTPSATPTAPQPPAAAEKKAKDTETEAAADAGPVREAPPAPPAPTGARALAAAGQHAAAVAAARESLASGSDAAIWRSLRYAAVAQDGGAAVAGQLAEGTALGGDAGAHHLLRADLLLAGGKAAAASEAASMATAADADGAAGATALAVLAGARVPSDAASARPADDIEPRIALLRFVSSRNAAGAAPWADAAAKVGGWRAALARGQAQAGWGDAAGALAAWATAADGDDPVGALAAGMARARHALDAGDFDQAATWAATAATAAGGDGNPTGAAEALALALEAGTRSGDPAPALEAAQAARDAAVGVSGGALAPELAQAFSRVAILTGAPGEALQAARLSLAGLPDDAPATQRSALSALAAAAAYEVGDLGALATMRGDGPAGVLAASAAGERGFALDTKGLDPADAALVGLAAAEAHVDEATRASLLAAAASAADRSGLSLLRLRAWLEAESSARQAGDLKAAATARDKAAAVFAEPSAPLRRELAARAMLAGLPATADGTWGALAASTAPPADATALESGVAAWAAARALAAQGKAGDAAKAYLDALGALPTHRQGRLSLSTVLDGSEGVAIAADRDLARGIEQTDASATIALSSHELQHRVDDVRQQITDGRDLVEGLTPAQADAVAGAAARARAGVLAWLAGGAAPDLAALQSAEESLAEDSVLSRLLPRPAKAAPDVAAGLGADQTGVLSYVRQGGRLLGVAYTPRGLAIVDLGDAAALLDQVQRYGATLRRGGEDDALGDRVRTAVLDQFGGPVSGVPRYVVVGPVAMRGFSLGALPEEASALRFLDDIRDTSTVPTLGSLEPIEHEIKAFKPDLLVLGAAAAAVAEEGGEEGGEEKKDAPAGAKKASKAKKKKALGEEEETLFPGEIDRTLRVDPTMYPAEVRRVLDAYDGGRRQLVAGPDATMEAWSAGVETARTIFIADVGSSADGGFVLIDGTVGLEDIRALDIRADTVFIDGGDDVELQLARAHAFLDAGAEQVLVRGWSAADFDRDRFYQSFYEALNQDRPFGRAVEAARQSVRNSPMREDRNDSPGIWGAWMVVGRP